jgi:poly-gamma-glutamate synthesis protein (capsule biosynthesis protein)
MIRIIGVGDIMPGGLLHGSDQQFVSEQVQSLLNQGDIRIGTLECAVGNTPDFIEEKMSRYGDVVYVPDEDLKRIKALNLNMVSLANNHFFDLKVSGANHTIQLLDEYGIKHIGAGMNLEEARKPAVFNIRGKAIAILAFCDVHKYMGYIPIAKENSAGVNPLDEAYALGEIKNAKKQYDYVVVMPHWGREHTFEPPFWCYQMAKKMFKAGADLILGSHPHRVQTVVNKRGKSVAYSMGNFYFPDRLIAPPLRVTYYPQNSLDIKSLPTTDGYPEVKEVTYKIWKPLARYGMIVSSQLDEGKVRSSYQITHIDSNNFLDFAGETPEIDKNLAYYHKILIWTPYLYTLSFKKKLSLLFKKVFR